MIQDVADAVSRSSEKARMFVYFLLMLVLSTQLATMLGNAWQAAVISKAIIGLHHLVGISLEAVSVLIFGVYVGFLLLMLADPKKRWQGALLSVGTLLALLGLQSMGLFLPNVNLVASAPWLVGGALVGIVLGGGRQLFEIQQAEALEFRSAARYLYFMIAGMTVVGLLEYHIVYPDFIAVTAGGIQTSGFSGGFGIRRTGLVKNVVVSGLFIVTVRQFVQYDAEKDFFVLGPRASGKSLFLIGSYLEALDRSKQNGDDTPLNPSQDLMSMISELDRRESEWIVEATAPGEVKTLDFQYVHGSVFPTNIQLHSIDYAGEYLNRLPDALTGAVPRDDMDNTLVRLAEGVENADTLLLTLDTERFANNEPLNIEEYFSILQATTGKDVIIVATKADFLAEDFREEEGLEAHRYYDDFKQYVNTRLRQSENVDSLIRETAGAEIHPVYYQTTTTDTGDRVPMRDANGSVQTVGFDKLLEKLGKW